MKNKLNSVKNNPLPTVPGEIGHGDMPGDKIRITPEHISKAELIFRALPDLIGDEEKSRLVISVYGGSGVGKSEIASVLAFFLESAGVGCYVLSGDNYPRRIPKYNDAERLGIFRTAGVKALAGKGLLTPEAVKTLRTLQQEDTDADKTHCGEYPWFETYLSGGLTGLKGYLGTPCEIDFDDINSIIKSFREGSDKIWLKRMGREESELWYDLTDFSRTDVLIIEWTHGNSEYLSGVDLPIFLNSTPEETLAHRRERARDKGADSPFVTRVLEIEQSLLESRADKAALIISKKGEVTGSYGK